MQKNYLIIGAVAIGIIVIAAGGFFFLNQNQSSETALMTDDVIQEDVSMTEDAVEGDEMMMEDSSSKYLTHSANILEETNGIERVLFFYANWCPTCRPVDTELRENSDQIPESIKVIRVNYNDPETDAEEEQLASTYGVNYQHTFVHIDENGNEISKWSSGGLDEILENVQ